MVLAFKQEPGPLPFATGVRKDAQGFLVKWLSFSQHVCPFLGQLRDMAQSEQLKSHLSAIIESESGGDGGKPHDQLFVEALVSALGHAEAAVIGALAQGWR